MGAEEENRMKKGVRCRSSTVSIKIQRRQGVSRGLGGRVHPNMFKDTENPRPVRTQETGGKWEYTG